MLILRGSPALSPFRIQKLLADLVSAGLPARALTAEFVHVAEIEGALTAAQRSQVQRRRRARYPRHAARAR
mgnify:CR=1 FL=1